MQREIEIKCLLDGPAARDQLVAQLQQRFPQFSHLGTKTIISYFYQGGATKKQVSQAAERIVRPDELMELKMLLAKSDDLVVKCRSINDAKFFAVKGSPVGEDPVHAVNRLEFEVEVRMDLESVNAKLESAGIHIASKWSSRRDFYRLDDSIKAEIEFVAGYGYKAELEIMIQDGEPTDAAVQSIQALAKELGLVEASQELLGRMYNYYNQHWQEYFNTDKVFDAATWQALKTPTPPARAATATATA